jgi:hypothetical protein
MSEFDDFDKTFKWMGRGMAAFTCLSIGLSGAFGAGVLFLLWKLIEKL